MTDEERLDAIDKRFEGVAKKVDLDELGKSIDQRFDAVHEQFGALDQRLDGFATKSDLEQMGTAIRNHFDLVAEAFKAEVKVIADGHSHPRNRCRAD